jgi:hypothetical protein
MSARSAMTHRATIERLTHSSPGATEDEWGHAAAPEGEGDWEELEAAVPCRVWYSSEREVTDGDKTAAIEDRRAIMPLGTDVTEGDRILSVTDRRGNELFAGPIRIESVGRRIDHLALMLEAV